ncbi:Alanine--tRNA ligase [Bienertia sinuspersici]
MIWYLSPLRLDGDQAQCGSVRDWVQDKLKTIVDIRWRSLFWSLAAWSIWLRRNKWIYEGKKLDLNVVIQRAIGSSNEFDEAFKDHQGDVVAATCQTMCGEFEVKVAEALAVWHTLGIAFEAGFRNVTIEDIQVMASYCTRVDYSHVKRDANQVAHKLARLSSSFDEMRVWLEEVPSEV